MGGVRSRAHREALLEPAVVAVAARLLDRAEDRGDHLAWGEGESGDGGEGANEGESEGGGEVGGGKEVQAM